MNTNSAVFLAELMNCQDEGKDWTETYRTLKNKYGEDNPMLKMLKELHARGVQDKDLLESLAIMAESVTRTVDIRQQKYKEAFDKGVSTDIEDKGGNEDGISE